MAKKREAAEEVEVADDSADSREAALAALFQKANKKWGKNTLIKANDYQYQDTNRISTGVLALDYALGGGLPVGRISVFYGHKSSGKTTGLLRAAGIAQKMCSNCWAMTAEVMNEKTGEVTRKCIKCGNYRKTIVAWIDVEGCWDTQWSAKFLNEPELILSQPEYAEQASDIADSLLRSGTVDIVILDSIAFLTPSAEIAKSAEEATVGAQARVVGQLMRKFVSGINEQRKAGHEPTIWCTNQIRMKVGLVFGNPEVQPGGLAQGFAASVEVRCSHGKVIVDEETGVPQSVLIKAKVEKNKTFPPNMEAEYTQMLVATETKRVGDVYDEVYAVDMGLRTGLITGDRKLTYKEQDYGVRSLLERHFMLDRAAYDAFKAELLPKLIEVHR